MKKLLTGIICILLGAGIAIGLFYVVRDKHDTENDISSKQTKEKEEPKQDTQTNNQTEGYEVKVSKTELTVKKGEKESFDITFTNPDESSIREYINCKDQSDIVIVRYSDYKDRKISVDVEGLKVGTTEIEVSDYNYPNRKVIVKVKVID